VLGLALSATAFGGNEFRLYAAADQHPSSGNVFSVRAHGYAARTSLLYLYLDRKPCLSTWAREANRSRKTFTSRRSYFPHGTKHEAFVTRKEAGQFYKSFNAIAGTTAGREYACAYLTTRDSRGRYRVTADAASANYTVTN
jgi:hypothetical protein